MKLTPVTNLAHALRADSTAFARVHSVVWMGGALDVPGNTSPSAEFNCFADPYAAQSIIDASRSGLIKLIMAPLDITSPHTIPFDDLIHRDYMPVDGVLPAPSSPSPGPLVSFTSAMLVRVRGLQASFGLADAMEMHDPVAVWYAITHVDSPAGQACEGWELKAREFKVERTGEHTRGMCVVDRRGAGDEGQDRTKSDRLKNGQAADGEQSNSAPIKKEAEANAAASANLPLAITGTLGSEVLRRLIMERVFGVQI